MQLAVPRRPATLDAAAFWRALIGVLISALICLPGARPASAAVIWNKIYTGFSQPVEITQAHDGSQQLFVVQQSGAIRIIKNGAVVATPFIDLGGASGVTAANGEQGLLRLALH